MVKSIGRLIGCSEAKTSRETHQPILLSIPDLRGTGGNKTNLIFPEHHPIYILSIGIMNFSGLVALRKSQGQQWLVGKETLCPRVLLLIVTLRSKEIFIFFSLSEIVKLLLYRGGSLAIATLLSSSVLALPS